MPYTEVDGLRYYSFSIFEGQPVRQGIFTRHGGISPSPWQSLNVGGTNGDDRACVVENRRRMFAAFGRPVESLFDVWQVHGKEVAFGDSPRPLDAPHLPADIILTDNPHITLLMRFGDCVPVMLFDPRRRVIGLAHAGWQGTVQMVARAALEAMHMRYGTHPADVLAGIGPSVAMHHYEVGQNVIDAARKAFGGDSSGLLHSVDGRVHFDLWEANRLTLQQAGVTQVDISGVCTVCDVGDYFSHRAEKGKTGRFGALFALQNGRSG